MSEPISEAWVAIQPDPGAIRRESGYAFGFVPAMGRLINAHARLAPHFGRLFAAVMFEDSTLNRREREMVAAVAAAAQDCHY
jgi:hypothetical protein